MTSSASGVLVDRTLSALADPHRRRVVDLLSERPRRAGELAIELGVTAPTMSRHLRVLRDGGLVRLDHPSADARVRVYSLDPEPMDDLRAWLDRVEAAWSSELAAFKRHIESAPT